MSLFSLMAAKKRMMYLTFVAINAIAGVLLLAACQSESTQKSSQSSSYNYNNNQNLDSSVATFQEQPSQEHLDALAKNLKISYQFLSNIETDCPDLDKQKVAHCYSAILTLQLNKQSNVAYHHIKDWRLNYSQVYPSYGSSSETLNLVHLNGDIHQISPKENFNGFREGKPIKLNFGLRAHSSVNHS
jgi:hexosaminidase